MSNVATIQRITSTLYSQKSKTQNVAGWQPIIITGLGSYDTLDIDFTLGTINGGTTPSIGFKLSRLGADGVAYPLWTPAALSAPGVLSTTVGSGFPTNMDFGDAIQIDLVQTGAPTSFVFSGSVKAKS